jgi:hypothetical protein
MNKSELKQRVQMRSLDKINNNNIKSVNDLQSLTAAVAANDERRDLSLSRAHINNFNQREILFTFYSKTLYMLFSTITAVP